MRRRHFFLLDTAPQTIITVFGKTGATLCTKHVIYILYKDKKGNCSYKQSYSDRKNHILEKVRGFILGTIIFFAVVAMIFSFITVFAYPLKYKSHIREAAAAYNIDASLIAGIIRAESSFKSSAVSPKGAIGLMQIMPPTAEFVAKKMGKTGYDLFDPKDNINMGTFYLRYLIEKFGDLRTALIAYNAGEGNVTKWLDGASKLSTSPFPETNTYVERVLNAKNFYKYRI